MQVKIAINTEISLLSGDDSSQKRQAASLCEGICALYLAGEASYSQTEVYDRQRFQLLLAAIEGGLPSKPAVKASSPTSAHKH